MESLLKKLNIKINPNRLMCYILYVISILICLFILARSLGFAFGNIKMKNDISPYIYAIFLIFPPLAYSFFVNSKLAKSDRGKVNAYMFTLGLLGIIAGGMAINYLNCVVWWGIQKIPSYDIVLKNYPSLFSPAIKSICFLIPFIGLFKGIDYFLYILRDEDEFKGIAGFCGLTFIKKETGTGPYTCSVEICKNKETGLPVIVPEKKRYEATLVQGATGTGKTATVLLPMSAYDLEKKFFFRECGKKIGYSLLKKGVAYMSGPFDNEYINKNFSLDYIKPKRGMENEFYDAVKPMIQYEDAQTGKIVYRNIGVTVVENDGNYISNFVKVAKNFDIDVLSVDPGSPETTLSINPFAIPEAPKAASIIADVLNSMYESTGDSKPSDPFFTQVTLDAFQNLAILLKEMYPRLHNGEIASLEDMLELLYNFDQVEAMTEELKKVPELEQKYRLLIAYFEKNFYKPSLNINGYEIPGTRGSGRKETEKFLYGAITQLNNLIRNPGLKRALCGKKNILNFDTALEKGQIITACSRKGELGIIQSKAFGMFFILQFQDAVLRRSGSEDSRIPHFLYIDEFPEYINKDMDVMFTLFRKYRCGVTIAIQNLSQLEKSGKSYYRQTVLANTKTKIIFGDTVPEDSTYWEKALGTDKVPDLDTSYKIGKNGVLEGSTTFSNKKKSRADWYKIENLGFGAIFYKTKDFSGNTVFGKGKTSFLDARFKKKADTLMFNFEKYMMTKPDSPTIKFNESDDSTEDDKIFGVNTVTKLSESLDSLQNESIVSKPDNATSTYANSADVGTSDSNARSISDDFEIIFEDEPTLEDAKQTGGAITETYESPTIKKNN